MTEEQYHIFSYYPKSAERNFELYEIEMNAGCEFGYRTFLQQRGICSGYRGLDFSVRGRTGVFLETEDALCSNASLSHCYINNVIGYTRSADF